MHTPDLHLDVVIDQGLQFFSRCILVVLQKLSERDIIFLAATGREFLDRHRSGLIEAG